MEKVEYTRVSASIQSLLRIDLSHYKDKQMRRRLGSWLSRSAAPDWDSYLALLEVDGSEREKFRNYLTINVSQFFRDPLRWATLQNDVLPSLLGADKDNGRTGSRIRIWSAGCSIGAESFSLAILLEELAPGSKHFILGTDIDRGALQRARNGGPYSEEDVREVSERRKDRCFKREGGAWYVREDIRRAVQFREQDLLNDNPPMHFDLIVCRNVVIYFTQETKAMLYHKFASHLKPGGILFLGGTEIIPRPQEYRLYSRGISLYGRDEHD